MESNSFFKSSLYTNFSEEDWRILLESTYPDITYAHICINGNDKLMKAGHNISIGLKQGYIICEHELGILKQCDISQILEAVFKIVTFKQKESMGVPVVLTVEHQCNIMKNISTFIFHHGMGFTDLMSQYHNFKGMSQNQVIETFNTDKTPTLIRSYIEDALKLHADYINALKLANISTLPRRDIQPSQ